MYGAAIGNLGMVHFRVTLSITHQSILRIPSKLLWKRPHLQSVTQDREDLSQAQILAAQLYPF